MFRLRLYKGSVSSGTLNGILASVLASVLASAREMWNSRNLSNRVMKELRILRRKFSSAVENLNILDVRYEGDDAEKGRAIIKIKYTDKENNADSLDIILEYWDNELEVTIDNRRAGKRYIKVFKDADPALRYIKDSIH